MFGCLLGQIHFRYPDFLSVELVEGTSVITGPQCNKGPSVITFAPKLKMETFSGRRRPDWQSNPGTEVAVASLQNSNIKIAVNSGGQRLGRLPKRKIWLHMKN